MGDIIRDLPIVVFIIVVAFLVAMAGVAIAAAVHSRKRAAIIAATPTTPIGIATDGYREFEGKVEPVEGQTLSAPLTTAPVCWYNASVERWAKRSGNQSSAWVTVKAATSSAPFLVRDATGICIVQPDGAEVTATDKSVWFGRTPVPEDRNPPKVKPTESATRTFEVHGGPNSKFRYTEERIYPGDPLLVLGEFSTGRFGTRLDDGDDEDDEIEDNDVDIEDTAVSPGGDADADDGSVVDDDWDFFERDADLLKRATHMTQAWIGLGSGKSPFMLTTTSQAEHLHLTSVGSKAAFGIAVVPLAIAALLLWVRFAS